MVSVIIIDVGEQYKEEKQPLKVEKGKRGGEIIRYDRCQMSPVDSLEKMALCRRGTVKGGESFHVHRQQTLRI